MKGIQIQFLAVQVVEVFENLDIVTAKFNKLSLQQRKLTSNITQSYSTNGQEAYLSLTYLATAA